MIKKMKLNTKKILEKNFLKAVTVVVLVCIIFIGLYFLLDTSYKIIHLNHGVRSTVTVFIAFLLASFLYFGYVSFFFKLSHNEEVTIKELFSKPELYLTSIILLTIKFFLQLIGYILIIPGIIFGIMFSQSSYIILENPEIGVLGALKKSLIIMKGNWKEYFLFMISFLWYLLVIFVLLLALFIASKFLLNDIVLTTLIYILVSLIFVHMTTNIAIAKVIFYDELKNS